MKSLVASAIVLASMTSVALAGSPPGSKIAPPVQLTNAELDQVSAGFSLNVFVLGGDVDTVVVDIVPVQGQNGNGFGGACQFCEGPQGNAGPGIFVQVVLGNGPIM